MDPGRRRELKRYGAPVLFLLAVTIAVLLIKSGLDNGSDQPAAVTPTTTTPTTTAAAPTTTITLTDSSTGTVGTTTAPANAQYYVIQSGDTLGSIAAKYNTTVDQLTTLNPGVDPSALQPGQRIRVG
jgi:LysM repeat protein